MTLPQLAAGGEYVVTYSSSTKVPASGVLDATNHVLASSKDTTGTDLYATDRTTTEFGSDPTIEKSGELQSDGSVAWTIKLNTNGSNLEGWTLSDTPGAGITLPSTVTLTGADGTEKSVSLPYTFGSSSQEYTVTYSTDAPSGTNATNATNTATFTPPEGIDTGKTPPSSSTTVSYPTLTKDGVSLVASADETSAVLTWTTTIKPQLDGTAVIPSDGGTWTYTDSLQQGNDGATLQWFSADQQETIVSAVNAAFKTAGLTTPKVVFFASDGTTETADKPTIFVVTSSSTVPKDTDITFRYESSATIPNPSQQTYYTNNATLGPRGDSDYGQLIYEPLAQKLPWQITKADTTDKIDATDPILDIQSIADTTHQYDSLAAADDGSKLLQWSIEASLPSAAKRHAGESLTLTENLPKDLHLLTGDSRYPGIVFHSNMADSEEQWHTSNGSTNGGDGGDLVISEQIGTETKTFHTSVKVSDNVVTLTLPSEFVDTAGTDWSKFTVTFVVALDSSVTAEALQKKPESFANSANLAGSIGGNYGTATQTQTVTDPVVEKKAGTVSNNIIPYTLIVNPDGTSLTAGTSELTLQDVMSYDNNQYYGQLEANLIQSSIHVYHMNADGSQGDELSQGEVSFTYKSTNVTSGSDAGTNNNREKTIVFSVPDNEPLIITYEYRCTGQPNTSSSVQNTASVNGKGTATTTTSVPIENVNTDLNIKGIRVQKVDSANFGRRLAGAQFDLYVWKPTDAADATAGEWQKVTPKDQDADSFTTAEDGTLDLSGENASITYNTAYKLVETQAPEGYLVSSEPYYFVIFDSDTNTYPEHKPADYSGMTYSGGGDLYIPNDKEIILPNTGGAGAPAVVGAGAALIVVSAWQLRRRLRRSRDAGTGGDLHASTR
jgi:hypothetical protein